LPIEAEIIRTVPLVSAAERLLTEMRANEAGPTGDQRAYAGE